MINETPTAEYIEAVSAGYRSGEAPPNGIEESPQTQYAWGNRTRPAGAAVPARSPEELASENARLREEVERLREQRDILKKSLGILCEPPLRGLPKSKS